MRRAAVAVTFFVAVSAAAQVSDMSASKTAPASTTVGSTITFSVGITNNGPDAAANATFTDPLPSGVTFTSITQTAGPASTCSTPPAGTNGTVSCSVPSLAVNTSASWDIAVVVSTGTSGTTLVNTVTASSNNSDPVASNNSATTQTSVQANADLFVTKTAPATTTVGANITFTVTVGNNGPDVATSANVNDVLPSATTFVSINQTTGPTFTCSTPSVGSSGTVSCSIATLASGAVAQFDIVVNVSAGSEGTTLINTATVSSQTPDDNNENNTSVSGTTVAGGNLADISILKTGPAGAPPNSDVTYTIVVTNNGPNDATTVSWHDSLPDSVPTGSAMTFVSFTQNSGPTFTCSSGTTTTCSIAVFPNGSTATFTLVGHIPSGTASGKTYTNVAIVTSDNDPNPDNDSSATTVTVSSADVGVVKSAPATAIAGGPPFNYVVTLSNGGPDAATDVSFTDNLPAGINFVSITQDTGPAASGCATPLPNSNGLVSCTIPLLGNGQSAQFTITVQAASTVANGTVVSNTATASSSSFDANSTNNSSTAMTTISANADVAINKTAPATATAGTNITYTITVQNNGPSTANSVSFTDTLPAGTTFVSESQTSGPTFTCTTGATVSCSIASLAPAASATFSVTVAVSASLANGTNLSNTATVASTTPDSSSGNNTSSAPTLVSTSADVGINKTAPAAASAGTNVTYTITVQNAGPSDAASVSFTDTLPAGTTFVSESQTSGPTFTCTTGATVSCSIASLAAGASAAFNITVALSGSLTNGTIVSNTATVSSTTADSNPGNNTSTAPTTVSANADLSVTKSGPTSTPSNTNVTYTVVAANAGPANATTVTLTETVPAGMTFVSVNQTTGPAFSCSGTGPIVCTIASFAAGASATFQFTFNVPIGAVAGTQTSDTATISSATPDSNPLNNSASVTTTIGQSIPALSPLAIALLAMALAMVGWMTARR